MPRELKIHPMLRSFSVRVFLRIALLIMSFFGLATHSSQKEVPHFRTQIVPVLTQAGCNAAACHGAATGKGGFKLSLFAESAESDYHAIVRDRFSRRWDATDSDRSLLLRKASRQIDHEGGRRVPQNSPAYDLLKRWIVSGAPYGDPSLHCVRLETIPHEVLGQSMGETLTLQVRATFSDGSQRDVSKWCLFESLNEQVAEMTPYGELQLTGYGIGSVFIRFGDQSIAVRVGLPHVSEGGDFPSHGVEHPIDERLTQEWSKWGLKASPRAETQSLVRRLFFDLAGQLPLPEEAREWSQKLDQPNGYEQLVDSLLASPRFSAFWSLKQADWLRMDTKRLGQEASLHFYDWHRQRVKNDDSMLRVVQEMLQAEGKAADYPQVHFNRYARDPRDMGEYVGEVLLGFRIACARCHNHPTDRWTMGDYHDFAAIFSKNALEDGKWISKDLGNIPHPKTGEPSDPRLLGMASSLNLLDRENPLKALADWFSRDGQTSFEKAFLNRLWRHLFGQGIVEPVDDLRETNLPRIPGLLELMAKRWREQNHSLRSALKMIVLTQAYQQKCFTGAMDSQRISFFNGRLPAALSGRLWVDAVRQVSDQTDYLSGELPLGDAVHAWDHRTESYALDVLGRCRRESSCESAGIEGGGLARAMFWFNDPELQSNLDLAGQRLWQESFDSGMDGIVEELYWSAYARPPVFEERDHWQQLSEQASHEPALFLSDVLWALLNSEEFRWIR